jgi:probable HAF family extracellular repeat protein
MYVRQRRKVLAILAFGLVAVGQAIGGPDPGPYGTQDPERVMGQIPGRDAGHQEPDPGRHEELHPGQDCQSGGIYGDGSDGDVVIRVDTVLSRDMHYSSLVVHPGVLLDTAGYTVRVCGALVNHGVITDLQSGGGDVVMATSPARGQDPCSDSFGPPEAEDATRACGMSGPLVPQAGEAGLCGGSGGGGGGAINDVTPCLDADGGDGGAGGTGGRGGGYVRIYAYSLSNDGRIHADGRRGEDGHPGQDGEYVLAGVPLAELAGGGGGGGAGGGGGNGGTVEVYCAYVEEVGWGTMRWGSITAFGGLGGAGAPGGRSGTTVHGGPLTYANGWFEDAFPGGSGYPDPPEEWRGGDGGAGACEQGSFAEDGQPGTDGLDGQDGQVILEHLAPPQAPLGYEVVALGPAPSYWSRAYGINEAGQVAGAAETAQGESCAFRWTAGVMQPLPDGDADSSVAYDINDFGEVTGRVTIDGTDDPFLWLPEANHSYEAGFHRLPVSSGGAGLALNNHGQVVGTDSEYYWAFLWLPEPACGFEEGAHNLGFYVPFEVESGAFAINDATEVVGWSHCWEIYPPHSRQWFEAWLWRCSTPQTHQLLPHPDLGFDFHPRDISENSRYILGDNYVLVHDALSLDAAGPWLEGWLDPLSEGGDTSGQAINDAGNAVGWAVAADGQHHACYWQHLADDTWLAFDLNELVVDAEGWFLTEATDINEAGEIVGNGISPLGVEQGFLLRPYTGAHDNDLGLDADVSPDD